VSPQTVSLASLASAFRAISTIVGEHETGAPTDKVAVHLVRVTSGSARYGVAVQKSEESVRLRLVAFGETLKEGPGPDLGYDVTDPLQRLSRVAKRNNCTITLVYGKDVLAKVTPTTYKQFMQSAYVIGPASVYARIERVGGRQKLHCAVRMPRQDEQVWCSVESQDVVQQLGQNILETVLLHGEALYHRGSWRIKRFRITRVDPPKRGSLVDAMKDAYTNGGSAWADLDDPISKLAEIRGE